MSPIRAVFARYGRRALEYRFLDACPFLIIIMIIKNKMIKYAIMSSHKYRIGTRRWQAKEEIRTYRIGFERQLALQTLNLVMSHKGH